MFIVETVAGIHELITAWRQQGERIVFVPTMGNLHEGHLSLIREAVRLGNRTVVSIYINPTQFGENEDIGTYPRTFDEDSDKLEQMGVDLLFAPTNEEIYPEGSDRVKRIEVPELSAILCGVTRPHFFSGVATVVNRLFDMVQPDLAIFGEKDFQQLLVVKHMVADLKLPVEVLGMPTVREHDGLAMSSRNSYLAVDERKKAPCIYQALCIARDSILAGENDWSAIEAAGSQAIQAGGLTPDYFSVRRAIDLMSPEVDEKSLVILAAAWLGKARLIDNISLTR